MNVFFKDMAVRFEMDRIRSRVRWMIMVEERDEVGSIGVELRPEHLGPEWVWTRGGGMWLHRV